jgi:P-type E1-E2 ATPase
MITGDHKNTAEAIALSVGIKNVYADCTPEQKLHIIKEAQIKYDHVVMVGDGINDAPALAYASVGIAMAQSGETASTESADIVILHHSIEKIGETYAISQKTISIAKQGIWAGIGMSIIAMVFAITGTIKPLQGAILQEFIDVIVILGALRVLFIKI